MCKRERVHLWPGEDRKCPFFFFFFLVPVLLSAFSFASHLCSCALPFTVANWGQQSLSQDDPGAPNRNESEAGMGGGRTAGQACRARS